MKHNSKKMNRLLALLLTLVMLIPMALPAGQVLATEVTEAADVIELPTETVPGDSTSGTEEKTPVFFQSQFSDESDLANFDLYQSGTSKFVVSDGMLVADGTDGEQKAVLNKDVSRIESVSVNIIPGASGNIYGGVYVGAKNPTNAQDSINSMVFLIKSDYTGWSDAPNRIDIVQGEFNGGWKHIKTIISETGNGNNLFTKGVKEPLNLKLTFSGDVILLKLSLVSNPDKYVQVMYEVEPEQLQGGVGVRSIGSDTCYDKFIVNENYVPATLTEGLKLDGTGLDSYAKTVGVMTQKPVTIEAWVWIPKLTGGSRRQAIITNYTEPTVAKNPVGTWGLYTNEYTTLYYTERTSSGTFNHTLGVPVCNNSWNHVVVVRRQGALDVYWNGEFVQTIEYAGMGDTTVVENPMTIGYCSVAAGTEAINSLKGQVGDIRLWSTERTQAQIQADMYRELTGKEEGLIQHWNFDSQEKGIVSNTVEGGLDVELLGHTQIGNEDIRRWDFSQESHLEDFTFYYSPDYTSASYNYAFNLTDEKLYIKGSINNSGTDIKAILNEQIDNITYIGADVTQGGTTNSCSGILLGIKNVNSTTAGDYEGIRVRLGRLRTSAAKRPHGEINFSKANGTYSDLTSLVANTTFFPDANTKLPYHIQVSLDGNTANAHMYRLDDPTINNSQSYTFADGELDGQVGLWLGRTSLSYDNLTIISEIPQEDKPVDKDEILYENQGHNFYAESRAWKLTKDLTAAPYTMEAWVKVPVGVDDTTVAYIVGNASRAPSVSMQMIADGKLQLSYAVENADLTVTTKTFNVDTDLRTGKWTHVAYTCDVDADTVVAYINGVAVETWTDAGLEAITIPDKIIPGNTFAIGSLEDNDDPANKFIGWIADVRMWDRALSAAELKDSMMTQYTTAKNGLLFNAPLSEKTGDAFADLSGNGYSVQAYDTMLQLQTETHEPGSYSMVVIPDQQVLSHYSPDRLKALYQWIADNREKENIQIVMNVGDMADNCGNLDQWANNRAAWELLPDDLPFIVSPGNHDYDTNSGWNKGYGVREQLTLMNEYFPRSIFENYPTEIGFFDEVNSANQWQAFTVNGNQYLVMALEYVPQDDVIAWANEVVEAHPNHQVIMVTHSYVGSYGNMDVPKLWSNFLSKHENVIMAFSGHVWHTNVVRRTDKGVNGNDVHQMLMDAQVSDTGSEGNKYAAMIGILRFSADGTKCDVSYYSTDRDMYDAGSNFTLTLPKQEQEPTVEIMQQVSLQDDLAMNFLIKADDTTDVNVTFDSETVTYDIASLTPDENGWYPLSVNLAAAQMTEDIQLQFVSEEAVILEKTYSVRRYAEAILAGNYSDYIHNMVKWMLNYGAKAQLYFDVNEDDLANAGYELDAVALPSDYKEKSVSGSISGLSYYGASLVFRNKIAVRFYFTGSVEGVSFGSYEAVQKGNMYYVEVAGINPQDYSNLIDLTATKDGETLTVSYSPLNYIIRMSGRETSAAELKALLNALYGYHTAALQYVEPVTTDYEVLTGGVSVANGVMTVSEADTLMLHKTAVMKNGSFSVDLNTLTNANAAGIVFGADAAAESYYLFRMGNGSLAELVKVENGTQTVLDQGYLPANRRKDCTNRITVIREDNTICCYFESEHYGKTHCYAYYEDESPLTGDRIGLWAAAADTVFQNAQTVADTQLRKADVLIFGHSYTEMWTDYADYFPEYPSIDNVGLGGSVAVQWEQFPDELAVYEPKLGIYMIGINDLTGGTAPKAVVSSMEKTLLQIKELVPEFEVVVTAVNHCPNRASITQEISDTNALMRNLAASYDWIYYAETEYLLCTDPNDPLSADSSLFSDGLHPNAAGYALLTEAIRSAAKGENQPVFDEELAQAQLAEVKAAKLASMNIYGENAYTAENWVSAKPHYDAAVAKINACTTEIQLQKLDLSEEIAELEQIPNKGADVIAHILDPNTSDVRSAVEWEQLDAYTVRANDYVYALDNTAVYADSEVVFKMSNPSAGVGTAGVLLRGEKAANLGMYGYLINVNTNGNYIQIYYLNNSYNNDKTETVTKYIGGIVLNNYGINAVGTEFYAKIEGSTLYVNTLERHLAGETKLIAVDLTNDGAYEVYEQGHTGILSWTTSVFDLQLKRYAAQAVDTNQADEIMANLLNPDTRIERSTLDWTKVDDYTVHANGLNYALDGTAVYSDAEAVIKLSNATGNIGTAGLLLRATASEGKGVNGYLVNVNTNSNYIQIYHLSNNYNTDKSSATHTYVGGVVLNNYSLNAESTEYYIKIEGSTLYVNTVERQNAGTKVLATVDLTKGGTLEVYESGYTGVLSWVNGVSFDFLLKSFEA